MKLKEPTTSLNFSPTTNGELVQDHYYERRPYELHFQRVMERCEIHFPFQNLLQMHSMPIAQYNNENGLNCKNVKPKDSRS